MKKSNFAKLLSLVLVCVMLISTFSVLAFAEEPATESEIEIYSNNVLTGGTQRLMYAIKADEGAEFDLTVTDANGNEIAVSPYVVEGAESNYINVPSASKGDAMCYIFATDSGVAPQNIDEEVVATVTVDGEVVDTTTYSVLEYVYNRLYVSANASPAEKAMFTALLEYADLADVFYNGATDADKVSNNKFVKADNCVFDAEGSIHANGTTLTFSTDLVPDAGEIIAYYVTNYETGVETRIKADDNGEIAVDVDASIYVTAAVEAGSQTITETFTLIAGTNGTTGTKTISWVSGNVTIRNDQGKSTTSIRTSDSDHYRIYAKSDLIVSANGGNIKTIKFTCTSNDYATVLAGSLTSTGATASASGSVVTVTVTADLSEVTFTASAQTRIKSAEVVYVG